MQEGAQAQIHTCKHNGVAGEFATSYNPTLGITILKSLSRWVDKAEQNGFFPGDPSTFLTSITSNTHIISQKRGAREKERGKRERIQRFRAY